MKKLLIGFLVFSSITSYAQAHEYQCSIDQYTPVGSGLSAKISYDDVVVKELRSSRGLIVFKYDTKDLSFKVRHSHYNENGLPASGAQASIELIVDDYLSGERIEMELIPSKFNQAVSSKGIKIVGLCKPVAVRELK